MCHPYQASALCPPKYNFSVLLLIGSVSCPGRYFLLIPLILVESIWMALRKIELELLTWQVYKITLRRTSIIKYLRVLQTFLCLKNTAWLEFIPNLGVHSLLLGFESISLEYSEFHWYLLLCLPLYFWLC